MTKQKIFLLAVLLVLTLAFVSEVSALGVTPARRVISYEPDKLVSYDINILNSEGTDQLLAIYATGDFAEYVDLDQSIIRLEATDDKATVRVNLKQPVSSQPGTRKTNILITSLPTDAGIKDDFEGEVFSGNLDSTIGASIVVAHQLWVDVPYPGKYLKAQLRTQEFSGKPEFVISAYNVGTDSLEKISARVEILGATFEELAELRTNEISLESGVEGKVSVVWNADNVEPGAYRVRAVVDYDGETVVLEDTFFIGTSRLEIKDLHVNNFRLGTIAKLNLLIESKWNTPLQEIYAEFEILQNGGEVSNFLAAPVTIQPHAEETLVGYWDTEGFQIGEYDILAKVHYEGKTEERLYEAVVSLDEIKIDSSAPSGLVTGENEGANQLSLLIILVIGLIVLNVVLFIYIRRGKK